MTEETALFEIRLGAIVNDNELHYRIHRLNLRR